MLIYSRLKIRNYCILINMTLMRNNFKGIRISTVKITMFTSLRIFYIHVGCVYFLFIYIANINTDIKMFAKLPT